MSLDVGKNAVHGHLTLAGTSATQLTTDAEACAGGVQIQCITLGSSAYVGSSAVSNANGWKITAAGQECVEQVLSPSDVYIVGSANDVFAFKYLKS